MPTFTPPVVNDPIRGAGRLFSFYTMPQGVAVVWRNGHFVQVRVPTQAETALLTEGRTWFSGGRTYAIDNDTAALLETDGFTVVALGYGESGYGLGPYGG